MPKRCKVFCFVKLLVQMFGNRLKKIISGAWLQFPFHPAYLAEIFGRLRNDVGEQLDQDSPEVRRTDLDVEKHDRVVRMAKLGWNKDRRTCYVFCCRVEDWEPQ